ncbi:chemotaxis protein CheW [Hydrogenophaga crassostreae]|uniref:Chemotaxis protein CheW n=1 Tax=Hydrogenophaga crassostreae TaxID=1763535 RepID=A0A167IND8_9BURK|nr:chemotaxis protein CheW [Hydrogenophaga crassostreae]AOW14666.1 chemotaxis protein CheW [Hydrogenophaga crassostreae]OAD43237.1 chemotaxis protein CheW [Hydrogenophaga crassostreae]
MAQRQSLRDLQDRLARRLSAAKTDAAGVSWLAVEVSGQRFLLPLVQSGEIFSWAPVQLVPYTHPWYLGVAALRGGLYGVVDLAALPGVGAQAPTGTTLDRVTSESRLISLHPALEVNAVLWVDRLLGLKNPAMFSALGERAKDAQAFLGRVLVDAQGVEWQELDLQLLAGDAGFLNIASG